MIRYPISIQKLFVEEDKYGIQKDVWKDYFTCRAEINTIGGKEYYAAAQINAQNDFKFKIRCCDKLKNEISQNIRIIFNDRIFDVIHIDNYMMGNRFLILRCNENVK